MAILVRFRENKRVDSDAEVIGKVMEGEHEGKVAFLVKGTQDPGRYADQEIMCDVVTARDKSITVMPVNSSTSKGPDISSIFKDI